MGTHENGLTMKACARVSCNSYGRLLQVKRVNFIGQLFFSTNNSSRTPIFFEACTEISTGGQENLHPKYSWYVYL